MITEKDINNAFLFAAEILHSDSSGHDIEHIRRVIDNARLIIETDKIKNIDAELTLFACALHDADDKKLKKAGDGEYSNLNLFCDRFGYDSSVFNATRDIIDKISFTKNPTRDSDIPIEAKVAQDADRLDALGAVGISRAFSYGGHVGRGIDDTIRHFYDKLFMLPELMNTHAGKAIAEQRVEYMREFIRRLETECK